jgi:hypothetical protein
MVIVGFIGLSLECTTVAAILGFEGQYRLNTLIRIVDSTLQKFDIPMTPSYFKLHLVNGDNYICTRLTFTTISHNHYKMFMAIPSS